MTLQDMIIPSDGIIYDTKLKPCPFCGGDAVCSDISDRDGAAYQVSCTKCHAQMPNYYSAGLAKGSWNTRAYVNIDELLNDSGCTLDRSSGDVVWDLKAT